GPPRDRRGRGRRGDRGDPPLLLGRCRDGRAGPGARTGPLDRGAGHVPARGPPGRGGPGGPARRAGARDRLPVSAAPAVAGSPQRTRVPRRDCGPGERAPRAPRGRAGARDHADGLPGPGASAPARPAAGGVASVRARGGRPPAWRREVRRAVGGALNVAAARLLNLGRGRPAAPALELESYLRLRAPAPLDLARLLAGRPNRERARVTEAVLRAAGLPVVRQPYRTLEGAGVNLFVDVGPGPATLVLAAHHDAVPGSPGANDNAASIGILLGLARRLLAAPPRGLRDRRRARAVGRDAGAGRHGAGARLDRGRRGSRVPRGRDVPPDRPGAV